MKNSSLIQYSTATPARPGGLLSRLSGAFGLGKTFLKLSLILAALALPGVAPAGNLEGRYATITLDGSLSDWQPGDVMYSASEIGVGAPLEIHVHQRLGRQRLQLRLRRAPASRAGSHHQHLDLQCFTSTRI